MRTLTLVFLLAFILLLAYSTFAAVMGLPYTPLLTPLSTLTGFVFALLHASQRLGWWRALLLLGLTFGVSLLFESVGVATGLVYGPYHYTDRLGIKFLGLVPLLIPAAWFMMMYPSFVIADRVIPARWQTGPRQFALAAVGGVIMTAWDLAMDPLMVAGEHWVWEVKGAYFGVPLQNYWGWWLTTFITFILFVLIAWRRTTNRATAFDRLSIVGYAAMGLSTILVALQLGLEGPGLVGLFAMLPWVIVGWIR